MMVMCCSECVIKNCRAGSVDDGDGTDLNDVH